MADEDQPGQQPPSGTANLEERVARLELELAALRAQVHAVPATSPRPILAPAPVLAAPPPPMPEIPPRPAPARMATGFRAARPAEPSPSFEDRLGSQIFNRIAIILILIGVAYFLKLAIDRQWIGPYGRVLAGLIGGAALIVWSERFRQKGFAAFSYSLKAVGTGVLYLSLWAAFQLFHLLPASAALLLMIAVSAWNAYMAWSQDSELLAGYALIGGFATPLLLSTGGNHEIFLFTYLLAIDVATVALVRIKPWPRLLLGAFPVTVAFFVAWYAEFYRPEELGITSLFIVLFGLAFAAVPIARPRLASEPVPPVSPQRFTLLEDILLPLANAAFVALAFYSVLQDSGHHDMLPWLMLVLAAVYLALMRAPQTSAASAIHLSLAIVFLTIAIPLKASGAWITASWLVEGLALLWIAARLAPGGAGAVDESSAQASRVLRPLALASLMLGFGGICVHTLGLVDTTDLAFWNKGTGTALTGIALFAGAAWVALRARNTASDGHAFAWEKIAMAAFALIDATALLLTLRELLSSWSWDAVHPPFQTVDFFTALIGLAVFAGVAAVALRLASIDPVGTFWTNCAGASTVAFNLIAVLTGVREINAIWGRTSPTPEGALQQALAISAFLMLYGAALLAIGFWKRSGFLRWQALALLVFSIFKTFLYDMRNLSQGYRVVSFLGLGALLMAISFAYQKDWLHLRQPAADHKPDGAAQ